MKLGICVVKPWRILNKQYLNSYEIKEIIYRALQEHSW